MLVICWIGIGALIGLAIIIALGFKWEFDRAELFISALIICVISAGIASFVNRYAELSIIVLTAFTAALIVTLFAAYILARFFRDPDRKPRGEETQILSPADGRIIYIKNIERGLVPVSEKNGIAYSLDELTGTDLLARGGCLVGINMSFLDVHVNRAPVAGKIVFMHHIKGLFLSLRRSDAAFRNERLVTVFDNKKIHIGIVQIASRLVRSIVPFKKIGEEVNRGERIGMIRFGSQVDIVLPASPFISLRVQVGEKVRAGESIIGQLRRSFDTSDDTCADINRLC